MHILRASGRLAKPTEQPLLNKALTYLLTSRMHFQEPELMFSIALRNKSGTNAFLRQKEIPDFFLCQRTSPLSTCCLLCYDANKLSYTLI